MSYRDDREALLHRTEALERELTQTREQLATRTAENEQLQLAVARAEADEPEPPAPEAPRALVLAQPIRPDRNVAGWLVGAAWTVGALAIGVTSWMVPAAVVTTLGIGWLANRWRAGGLGRRLGREWPSLPIDAALYGELLSFERRSVVVRIEVGFAAIPNASDRTRIRKRLQGAGALGWEQGALTITSRTLRPSRDGQFDPEVIRAHCDRVFERLDGLRESYPIEYVRPRAKAR
jgi:hypothetical protein